MTIKAPFPLHALLRAGVDRDNIHVDKTSGAKFSRPKLDLVMQLLREGGIGLHVIEQGIDTSAMEGQAMFGMPQLPAPRDHFARYPASRPLP